MMGTRLDADCEDCITHPAMRCGRCTSTRCARHTFAAEQRCERCEHDWQAEAVTRRAAKLIFVPPVSILAGGLLLGLLLPLLLGGVAGVVMLGIVATMTAVGTGSVACRIVDGSARAMFLRERAGGLPAARLLPSPRHR